MIDLRRTATGMLDAVGYDHSLLYLVALVAVPLLYVLAHVALVETRRSPRGRWRTVLSRFVAVPLLAVLVIIALLLARSHASSDWAASALLFVAVAAIAVGGGVSIFRVVMPFPPSGIGRAFRRGFSSYDAPEPRWQPSEPREWPSVVAALAWAVICCVALGEILGTTVGLPIGLAVGVCAYCR